MPVNSPEKARKNTIRTPRDIAKQMGTRLQNRLLKHIMADAFTEPPPPAPLEEGQKPPKPQKSPLMTDSQVHAALGLLKKYLPDLKSVEFRGNEEHPLVHKIVREIIDHNPPADGPGVPAAAGTEPL
jgi:hypothetical protein